MTPAAYRCRVCEEEGLRRPLGICAKCGGPCCAYHDRCQGCYRLICWADDTEPTPSYTFPGALCLPHPHNEAGT